MPNNYDAAAWFYDALAKLVFRNTLIDAQRFLVKHIQPNTKVLVVGGGTGWILEEIAKIQASTLEIIYVEISAKMIALSKKRNCGQNNVVFMNLPIEDFVLTEIYDIILTPFLFDNFSETRILSVFNQLNKSLKAGGLWLLADFQVQNNYKSIWQKTLLQSMYWFFGWLCGVETKTLIKMSYYFNPKKYSLLEEKTFYRGFILSQVYQKKDF